MSTTGQASAGQAAGKPILLTTTDVAALFGVTTQAVRQWVESGQMPAGAVVTLPSGRYRFRKVHIDAIYAGSLNAAKSRAS